MKIIIMSIRHYIEDTFFKFFLVSMVTTLYHDLDVRSVRAGP